MKIVPGVVSTGSKDGGQIADVIRVVNLPGIKNGENHFGKFWMT
jgi:hypothetical protein